MNITDSTTGERDEIAQIVDPDAFESWERLRLYCIGNGDDHAEARNCADHFHKKRCDEARAKADTILSRPSRMAAASPPPPTEGEPAREELSAWLTANCGIGIPYGPATDEASMLHGLAYVLRQIEGTNKYDVRIGQTNSATTALRMALDHFACAALSPAQPKAVTGVAQTQLATLRRLSEHNNLGPLGTRKLREAVKALTAALSADEGER